LPLAPSHPPSLRSYALILLLLLFAIIYVTVISKRGKQEPWMVGGGAATLKRKPWARFGLTVPRMQGKSCTADNQVQALSARPAMAYPFPLDLYDSIAGWVADDTSAPAAELLGEASSRRLRDSRKQGRHSKPAMRVTKEQPSDNTLAITPTRYRRPEGRTSASIAQEGRVATGGVNTA
jgi:hypothetical protein